MKPIKSTITQSGLLAILKRMDEQMEFTIAIESDAKLLKTGNPLADNKVTKWVSMLVRVNEDYEKAVNEARKEEGVRGKFHAKDRAWGDHVEGTPLITHKLQYYLSCRVLSACDPVYYVDGKEAVGPLKELVEGFLPAKSESSRQRVEDEVVVRTIKLESIVAIQLEKDGEWLYIK